MSMIRCGILVDPSVEALVSIALLSMRAFLDCEALIILVLSLFLSLECCQNWWR